MSIKRNFLFSSVLTISNYIIPFITFPYVSRILGVSNIGLYGFMDSIVNYFGLFSMLGIGSLGAREIAKNKSNLVNLNKTFSNLLFLNAIFTVIAILFLLLAVMLVPKLQENWEFMILGVVKLIFNLFLTEWFFTGLEDFKYISIRSIIVKVLFVISVFLFVTDRDDVMIYYALMVSVVMVNAIINYFYRKKFITFSFKDISLSAILKPYLTIGLYIILTSMYTSFNVAYLGFMTSDTEVGYYMTATKIFGLILSLFTAFTAVMLPRISSLYEKRDIKEICRLTDKSLDVIISISVPLIIFTIILAPQIIHLISGTGFEGAIIPMRIIMPLILIIGIEQILVLQLLMPLNKDKEILINAIVGACFGIFLNIILIANYRSIGSAVVRVLSELSVLIVAQYFIQKELNIQFPVKKIFKNIIYSFPIFVVCIGFKFYSGLEDEILIVVTFITSFVYYIIVQIFWVKNQLVLDLINRLSLKKYK